MSVWSEVLQVRLVLNVLDADLLCHKLISSISIYEVQDGKFPILCKSNRKTDSTARIHWLLPVYNRIATMMQGVEKGMNAFDLSGKVALVTGTSGGLGQGMALGLAEAGADVICVSYSKSEDTVSKIQALGREAISIQADLSQHDGLEAVVTEALAFKGQIDILVNNAGIIRRTPAAEHSWKDFADVLDLNLETVFYLSQLVGRHMIERGSGKIISVASMLSYQGGINVPGYTASKHGVAGITKALANEWASKGIQVNAIAPGYMLTDNTAPIVADQARFDSITERIPAARWGIAEDMQGPVVFLASDASNYLNGHVLCVDGGWMAR